MTGWKTNSHIQPKITVTDLNFPWRLSTWENVKGIDWFLPEIMMIKEYCQMIHWDCFRP